MFHADGLPRRSRQLEHNQCHSLYLFSPPSHSARFGLQKDFVPVSNRLVRLLWSSLRTGAPDDAINLFFVKGERKLLLRVFPLFFGHRRANSFRLRERVLIPSPRRNEEPHE